METGYLLAIESSCDETAAAVLARDRRILANVIASQHDLHERFGGVVPEIASRAHLRNILPVVDEALRRAEVDRRELVAVAVTTHPGLVGSLLVGVTVAKTLAAAWGLPLIAVDHIQAHLYACRMSAGPDAFPAVGLVVSGGHSNLYLCRSAGEHELLGATIDDAAGEAFDKAARVLGLPYPGGPSISHAAEHGDPRAFAFPRSFRGDERLQFSFSGLKTALLYEAKGKPGGPPAPPLTPARVADLCASFEAAVVDVLVEKLLLAARKHGQHTICVGGGVAANRRLRDDLTRAAEREGLRLVIAPPELCTDNAAMAALAWEAFERQEFSPLDCDVRSGLVRR